MKYLKILSFLLITISAFLSCDIVVASDQDGDGFSDLQEMRHETDMFDPLDFIPSYYERHRFQIDKKENDAQEYRNGAVELYSDVLHMRRDWEGHVGLRYELDGIDEHTDIKSAKIIFNDARYDAYYSSANISIEESNNASVFTSHTGNISDRAQSDSLVWRRGSEESWGNNEDETRDLTPLLKSVIGRTDWREGNHVVFIFNNFRGFRSVESRESYGEAPKLIVDALHGEKPEYYVDTDKDGIEDYLDEDDDNDGLPDEKENFLGANHRKKDSDRDGVSDFVEYHVGSDLIKPELFSYIPGLVRSNTWLLRNDICEGNETCDFSKIYTQENSVDTFSAIRYLKDLHYNKSHERYRDKQFVSTIAGAIHVDKSGYYQFAIASGKRSELYFSDKPETSRLQKIVYLEDGVDVGQVNKYSSQQSKRIYLRAGEHYQFVYKVLSGSYRDYFDVLWDKPDDGHGFVTIDSENLSYLVFEGDKDTDGISDEDELAYGTLPSVSDSDGDGIADLDEIRFLGSNPLKVNSFVEIPGRLDTKYWFDLHCGFDLYIDCKHSYLLNDRRYPAYPSVLFNAREIDSKHLGIDNKHDGFAYESIGYITAPETGQYQFWLAGDDSSEFLLSTNKQAKNLKRRAFFDGATKRDEWGKYPEQKSEPIQLEKGKQYAFRIRGFDSGGQDFYSLAWTPPGEQTKSIIKSDFLSVIRKDIDRDGDGLNESMEYYYGTDPYSADSDKDSIRDHIEVMLGTSPKYYDTDGDGVSDGLEFNMNTNPLDKTESPDLKGVEGHHVIFDDIDGDGVTDLLIVALHDGFNHLLLRGVHNNGEAYFSSIEQVQDLPEKLETYKSISSAYLGNFTQAPGNELLIRLTENDGVNYPSLLITHLEQPPEKIQYLSEGVVSAFEKGKLTAVSDENGDGFTEMVFYDATEGDISVVSPANTFTFRDKKYSKIEAEFSVSAKGESRYTIPLDVPPARGQLQPNLSLRYNSSVKASQLGYGWSLYGLSKIHYCSTSLQDDGYISRKDNPAGEGSFCIDGRKLRHQGGRIYKTEDETFQSIRSEGNVVGYPHRFVASVGNGVEMLYEGVGGSWRLKQVSDRFGNSTHYHYAHEHNSTRIKSIQYSAGEFNYRIEFEYALSSTPVYKMLRQNVPSALLKRLKKIKVMNGDDEYWHYNLSYETGGQRERLSSIIKCSYVHCSEAVNFAYQNESRGIGATLTGPKQTGKIGHGTAYVDVNGDSLADACYVYTTTHGDIHSYKTAECQIATGSSFHGGIRRYHMPDNGLLEKTIAWVDFNADGLADLCRVHDFQNNNRLRCTLSTPQGFDASGAGYIESNPHQNYQINNQHFAWIDLNADGMADWCSMKSGIMRCYLTQMHANGVVTFPLANQGITGFSVNGVYFRENSSAWTDANGDGLQDFCYARKDNNSLECRISHQASNGAIYLGHSILTRANYGKGEIFGRAWIDINADGVAEYCNVNKGSWGYGRLQCANLFGFIAIASSPVGLNVGKKAVSEETRVWTDINSDGQMDFCYETTYWMTTGYGQFEAPLAYDCLVLKGWRFEKMTLPRQAQGGDYSRSWVDVNRDNTMDFCRNINGVVHCTLNHHYQFTKLVRITRKSSADIHINYKRMSDSSVYKKLGGSQYPLRDVLSHAQVVSSTQRGKGFRKNYFYQGRRLHLRGVGDMGFRVKTVTDEARGMRETTWYEQNHGKRSTGLVHHTLLETLSGIPVSRTATKYVDHFAGNQNRFLVYPQSITQIKYDVNNRNTILSASFASKTPDSAGRMVLEEQCSFDSHQAHASVLDNYQGVGHQYSNVAYQEPTCPQDSFTTKTETFWSEGDALNEKGRVLSQTKTATTRQHNASRINHRQKKYTQTKTKFEYYDAGIKQGMIKRTVAQADADNEIIEERDYQTTGLAAGQIKSKRISAVGEADRLTQYEYNSAGYLLKKTNAEGHYSKYFYHTRFPWLVNKLVDSNGVSKDITYDSFAKKAASYNAIGLKRSVESYPCDDLCLAGEAFYKLDKKEGRLPKHSFFDEHGRELRKTYYVLSEQGADLVEVKHRYNAQGQLAATSLPHYSGDKPRFIEYQYDVLGRKVKTRSWISTQQDTQVKSEVLVEYTGLSEIRKVETEAGFRTKTKTKDEVGNLVSVVDNQNHAINYYYDAAGNLVYLKADDAEAVALAYDQQGNKIWMDDPEKGEWTYHYDVFGNLIQQTDALGNEIANEYDKLNRKTRRLVKAVNGESETTNWVYDTLKDGKLSKVQSKYETKTYSYDNYARPVTEKVSYSNQEENYQFSKEYHPTLGYVQELHYPNELLRLRYVYDAFGFLRQQKDAESGAVFWEAKAANAIGQITKTHMADQMMMRQAHYDNVSGRLHGITSGSLTGVDEIISMQFDYDYIGNVVKKMDLREIGPASEIYHYDSLNRLTSVSSHFYDDTTQKVDIAYDSLGNIVSKSDVGTGSHAYRYDGTYNESGVDCTKLENARVGGSQALSSIEGYSNYCYDANGNMIQDDERKIHYTAFGKPALISRTADNSEDNTIAFHYGANHQRVKRIENNAGVVSQTTYVGKRYERIVSSNTDDVVQKIYIGDFAMLKKTNDEASKAFYFHRDHQGSIVKITDQLGITEECVSTDVWGKRRACNWKELTGEPTFNYTKFSSSFTNRGYTSHEHLDSVGLIHMNARVYDPVIGRFMSADDVVPDATDTQMLNRYAYVRNNPASLTDPSGNNPFAAVAIAADFIATAIVAVTVIVVKAITTNIIAFAVGRLTQSYMKSHPNQLLGQVVGIMSMFHPALRGASGFSFNTGLSGLGGASKSLVADFVAQGASSTLQVDFKVNSYIADASAMAASFEAQGGQAEVGAGLSLLTNGLTDVNTRDLKAEEKEYARLANGVGDTDFVGTDLHRKVGPTVETPSGLKYALFVNKANGSYVGVFAGTDSFQDFLTANFPQMIGNRSQQYQEAKKLALFWDSKYGGNISFTGHSLGGGLASAAASVTGKRATVFNAAALHPNTVVSNPAGNVTHIHSSIDILQLGNAASNLSVSGEQVNAGSAGWHRMGSLCERIC